MEDSPQNDLRALAGAQKEPNSNTKEIPQDFFDKLGQYDTNLGSFYDQEIEREQALERKSTAINLSNCLKGLKPQEELKRRAQLLVKEQEYMGRVAEEYGTTRIIRPISSDMYKRNVMRYLLTRGEVNTWALSNALAKMDGRCDPSRFTNACGVVEGYVRNGGQDIKGGTGLKQF